MRYMYVFKFISLFFSYFFSQFTKFELFCYCICYRVEEPFVLTEIQRKFSIQKLKIKKNRNKNNVVKVEEDEKVE